MRMRRVWALLCVSSLLMILVLAACGSATTSPSQSSAQGHSGSMSGMNMGSPTASTGGDPMSESLKNLSGKDFEIQFMQEMIVHHQSAIDMASLVPTHTKRAGLHELSRNIISAQTKEIAQMKIWLSQWYNQKPIENAMDVPGMMTMMDDMDKLRNTKDADFDKQFLDMMTQHHQQAVNMANLIPQRTQRSALVQLGQNIVKTQSAEIQQMQNWRKTWFSV